MLLIATAILSADTGIANAPILWVQHIPQGDKWAHAILYGGLALGLGRSFLSGFNQHGVAKAVIWVGLFAFTEELSQYWFPLRTLDVKDLIADVIGLSLAQVFLWHRPKKNYLEAKLAILRILLIRPKPNQ